MKRLFILLSIITFGFNASAQTEDIKIEADSTIKIINKKNDSLPQMVISLSTDGFNIKRKFQDSTKKKDKDLKFRFAILDLGINYINDKTDYSSAAAQNFLNVDPSYKNESLFSLREGKSINVNIYPVMAAYRLMNHKKQKIFVSSGIGLQIYNFRFNKPITYTSNPEASVYMDSLHFSKNKLAVNYLSIPLNVTFKTKLSKDNWLVYGAGVSGGFRLSSWMKQISSEYGKQKNFDQFNLNTFNSCVSGEIGIEGIFRLYATYQLTALHKDALDQHPFCIGIRFGGI